MIQTEKSSKKSAKARFPAAYLGGGDRRQKLIVSLNKGHTRKSDALMDTIAKAYGIDG